MKKILVLLFISLLFSTASLAEGLRCGTRIIKIGDHKVDVLDKCGEPLYRDTHKKCIRDEISSSYGASNNDQSKYRTVCFEVDEWTYKPSQGKFLTLLEISGSRVSNIRYGDR